MWTTGAARKQDSDGVWTYYLYYLYNKLFDGQDCVTEVAIAPSPEGPYTDHGPIPELQPTAVAILIKLLMALFILKIKPTMMEVLISVPAISPEQMMIPYIFLNDLEIVLVMI